MVRVVLGFFLVLRFILLMTLRSVPGSTLHVNGSGANDSVIVILIVA